jgi:hypothetical protein
MVRRPALQQDLAVRRALFLVLLTCLFGAVILVVPDQASACTCMQSSLRENFNRADAVFVGALDHGDDSGDEDRDRRLEVFEVSEVFKGTARHEQGVVSPAAESNCGLRFGGEGPFVVFASRSAHLGGDGAFTELAEGQYAASTCGGTAPATDELEEALKTLASLPGDPQLTNDPLPGAAGLELASSSSTVPTVAGLGAVVVLLVGTLLVRRRLLNQRR